MFNWKFPRNFEEDYFCYFNSVSVFRTPTQRMTELVRKVVGYKVVHTSFPDSFECCLTSQPAHPDPPAVHSPQDLSSTCLGRGPSSNHPCAHSACISESTADGGAGPRPGRPLAVACGSYPGPEQARERGWDRGGGGAGRGGEEKVALGSLESWEVAAAGFASLRACVRERAREQEKRERAPAMPIRPRLAAPGRGARPDSLRPGPARPPAPRVPRRVLPSPRPGGPSPPPGPAPRRSPALLSPSLPAAEQHGGARAAAARPSAAPLSPARGQLGAQIRPPPPPRSPPHLSHCAPLERGAPLGPCAPQVSSIIPDPASRDPSTAPGVPHALDRDAARDFRAPWTPARSQNPGLGGRGCVPW